MSAPTSYAFQWNRVTPGGTSTAISGATTQSYTPVAADIGFDLSLTIIGINSAGNSVPITSAVTGLVSAGAPVFTAQSPPAGKIGTAYAYSFLASNATSWALVSGSLPAGLALNSSTGVLSGTPTTSATSTFVISASNSSGTTASSSLSITVSVSVSPPAFTAQSPPGGTVGTSYSYTFTGSGTPTFALASGVLPPGLAISSAGVLSGTPTAAGTDVFVISATNAGGSINSNSLSVVIAAAGAVVTPPVNSTPPAVTDATTAGAFVVGDTLTVSNGAYLATAVAPTFTTDPTALSATVGTAFSQTYVASGVVSYGTTGTLPGGITINSAGVLAGTPTAAGTFTFNVTATNQAGTTSTPTITATVAAAATGLPDLVVTSFTLSPAAPTAGQAVTFSAVITNQGTGPTPAGTIVGVGFNLGGTISGSTLSGATSIAYSDTDTTSLAAGASVTLNSNSGQSWTAVAGTQTITAWVNDAARFSEASTTNNFLSKTVTVAAAAAGTNIPITNTASAWTGQYGNSTVAASTAVSTLSVLAVTPTGTVAGDSISFSTNVAATAGTQYNATGYCYATAANRTASISITFYNSSYGVISTLVGPTVALTNGSWVSVASGALLAPTGTVYASVLLDYGAASGNITTADVCYWSSTHP